MSDPRAVAYAALGIGNYLDRFPGASDFRRRLARDAEVVMGAAGSEWPETWPGNDWALPVQVLAIAGDALERADLLSEARSRLDVLLEVTSGGTRFLRDVDQGEESPVAAATFIDSVGAVYRDTRDPALLLPIRAAADWLMGANRHGLPLYDFATAGCHDALTAGGLNENQGTEASVFCLMSFLTLYRLAGDNEGTRE
jgi:hypothetical protein